MRCVLPPDDAPTLASVKDLPLFGGPKPWDLSSVRPPLARLSDPAPSHEAARNYVPDADAQNKMIVGYFRGVGSKGATYGEAALALGFTHEQVARRGAGLRQAKLIYSFDGKQGPLATRLVEGHRASVIHVAASLGLPVGEPPELQAQRQRALAHRMTA